MAHLWRGVIEEYRGRMPVTAETPVITLGEGGTPLVESAWLSQLTGCQVWLKIEGDNPTGSFKDRGMTVAMSIVAATKPEAVVCASTGNTSASAAAYAARAGITCGVLVPAGKIALGKLAQAVVHGARLIAVRGNFDDCLRLTRELADTYDVGIVNSVNRVRIQGQKSAAFEIVDRLGFAPDIHCIPVGNAGNISAYWAGFTEYATDGIAASTPRMWGFQADGAAPFVSGGPIVNPETIATAIRIGSPASWDLAIAARDDSGGSITAVTDAEILAAQRNLARREGVFVEPGSAASVAGLLKSHAAGLVDPGQTITVTVTGHGLKDVETALSGLAAVDPEVIAASSDAAAVALGIGPHAA